MKSDKQTHAISGGKFVMKELKVVTENYPHMLPLKDGRVTSEKVHLNFTEFKFAHDAFDDQVDHQPYDVCELAVGTFFQALDFHKPLRLLPVVCLGSFHHGSIWYDPEQGVVTPEDLKGARVAVKAYTQTTGLWCRGALQEQFGILPGDITWVTTEAPHVAGYVNPKNVVRAPEGMTPMDLIKSGDCKAIILGPRNAKGTTLKPVIPNVQEAVDAWRKKHSAIPINHMITVTEDLIKTDPQSVQEVYNMFKQGYEIASKAEMLSPAIRIGTDAVWHTLEVCMDYCVEQKLISRKFTKEEVFAPVV